MENKRIQELSERIYAIIDPWERVSYEPEDIAESIKKNPLDTIAYLLELLEN